jgi:hypothetical protein
MKTISALLVLVLAGLLTGCQSPHPDWNARIGHYTLDQAVVDYGPPDSQAKLADGRIVAKWISRFQTGGTAYVAGGFHARIIETSPGYYESSLILTFAPNNILADWRQR